jgi:hypothetical protein
MNANLALLFGADKIEDGNTGVAGGIPGISGFVMPPSGGVGAGSGAGPQGVLAAVHTAAATNVPVTLGVLAVLAGGLYYFTKGAGSKKATYKKR